MNKNELAINGGNPLRRKKYPWRNNFGKKELKQIEKVFYRSWKEKNDFGYQGYYEKIYTDEFCKFISPNQKGYADAVSSGTAALYVALAAFEFAEQSEVLVSPVTDPGSISAVILNRLKPIIIDSEINSFNIDPDDIKNKITPKTKCIIVTHIGGIPAKISKINKIAKKYNLKVVEDCSQAHGAEIKDKQVGSFGDISIFSTMFSKNQATGGCGGIIFTYKKTLYWKIRSYADRGKPFNLNCNCKDPKNYLFPALNFNQDELSCAIGIITLKKLKTTINKRMKFLKQLKKKMKSKGVGCKLQKIPDGASPFFCSVEIPINRLRVSKKNFTEALSKEGVNLNPHYPFVVCEWDWVKKYCDNNIITPNALTYRNKTFNILFNENFKIQEAIDIADSILKVEKVYLN